MKKITCPEPGSLVFKEEISPQRQNGELLLKVKRVGICGTDYHAYRGIQPFFSYPRVLGHEIAAEVMEHGKNSEFKQGDKVTILPYYSCGTCIACRNGKPNCCTSIQVAGVHTDGGMQEIISVNEKYSMKCNDLLWDEIAMVEPLSIAAHSIRRAEVKEGEQILVMGVGPIGLGITALAKAKHINVIAVDVDPERLKIASEKFHADKTFPVTHDICARIAEFTHHDFVSFVFDASGSKAAIEAGLSYLAHGGKYILVGLQKESFSFNHPEFHKRETTLMSSRNATKADFDEVIRLLKDKKIDVNKFITNRLQFYDLVANFEHVVNERNKQIKVLIDF